MSQFQDKSDTNSQRVVVRLSKFEISGAALEAFGKSDEDSEQFLRSLLYQIYRCSPTSRKDFEKDLKSLFKEVCDEADRFHLHYGGNSGNAWRTRKYPDKKWDWDWDSKIPKKDK